MQNDPRPNGASALQVAWSLGKAAAWQNRLPALCLWLFGIAIIVGYYRVDYVREVFESLGQLKTQSGVAFGILSTSVFGGILPTVLPVCFGRSVPKGFLSLLISNAIFWGFKGLEVDVLYQLQAWAFGDTNDPLTIAKKVFVDMAIYAPTIGLFNCILFYIWRDNQYSVARTRANLGQNWYAKRVLPALISNWCVWGPSAILIYSLPLALQLPVQNLILCFWVLILVFFTKPND